MKPRVLFTTPVLEHPPAGGPALRIENSIKALHQIAELHLISRVPGTHLGDEAFYRSLSHAFSYAPSARLSEQRVIRSMQHLVRRVSPPDDARAIVESMHRHSIGILWAGYGNISYELMRRIKQLDPKIEIVCDTDSVWSRYILRGLPYETSPARRRRIEEDGKQKEEEERAWVNLCDVTTAVSDVDAEYYRSLAREPGRVMQFSNVIDLDSYADVPPPPAAHRTPNLYLAGTFGSRSPMEHAARWVADEVFPRVLREIPELHWYIAGAYSDATLSDLQGPHITVTGKLPSVLPYLSHATVALVPLFFESGTRFKILEAAACGIPIVSTSLGAEGLPLRHEEHLLLADTPEAFAQAIIRVVRDRGFATTMAAACRAYVQQNCAIPQLVREGEAILSMLNAPR